MTALADAVLPLIRTRSDLHRYHASNAHGTQMHEAVDRLEAAVGTEDPADVLAVTEKALASALRVIMRADDSAGIIGDTCRRLVELHPVVAARADTSPDRLVEWMIRFQFEEECDYFTLDPGAYAPALGERGMRRYRHRLDVVRRGLGEEPGAADVWRSPHSGTWFTLRWNAQRLAVHDRDTEEVIRTHVLDGSVPAWFHETARALEEIGDHERAIEYARRAVDHPTGGHQALQAAELWCQLLAAHAPGELVDARLLVFERWPLSTTAARLREVAGARWSGLEDEVLRRLESRPREAVLFALLELGNVRLAWDLAELLVLDDADAWMRLAKAYEAVEPTAVLPVYERLVRVDLETTGVRQYRVAAGRLKRMRRLAAGTEREAGVDDLVLELREEHRRRPRLQLEFDRVGLPRAH